MYVHNCPRHSIPVIERAHLGFVTDAQLCFGTGVWIDDVEGAWSSNEYGVADRRGPQVRHVTAVVQCDARPDTANLYTAVPWNPPFTVETYYF